ncbi:MAG: DMT family transporter [Bacteroidetes bacterium]|jgi:drug/metabolite transporter (DMT)-like permease|nr:DMT family transporter [Bacteroidota bacterium]
MSKRTVAILAALAAAVIYGMNYTIAKAAMPVYVQPYGFIVLRVVFATAFFWLLSIWAPKEKIDRKDYLKFMLAAVFGVAVNMLAFFKGLNYTTPISASIIMVTSPIMVLLFSRILLKEHLSLQKIVGIFLGLIGTLIVIFSGATDLSLGGEHAMLGNLLVYTNASSYALYLVIVSKIVKKYHPLTFVKWIYTFGLLMVLPFGLGEVLAMKPAEIPDLIWLNIGYVLLFATCGTYLFNLFAVRTLKASTVGVFIYLQPLVAGVFAVAVGADKLSIIKIGAAIVIFIGVYLVTKKPKETPM